MRGSAGSCEEMRGDTRRCEEIRGDARRYEAGSGAWRLGSIFSKRVWPCCGKEAFGVQDKVQGIGNLLMDVGSVGSTRRI